MPLSPFCLGSRANMPVFQDEAALLSGGSAGFVFVPFAASAIWVVPAGVTFIDVLAVGGGGDGQSTWGGFFFPSGGGGGGGVDEQFNIPVVPGVNMTVQVSLGGGADLSFVAYPTLVRVAQGNDGATNNPAVTHLGCDSGAPSLHPGGGPLFPIFNGGGGGGAGGNGGNAGVGFGGNGGPGLDVSARWTKTWGQLGVFGGGGGGQGQGVPNGANGIGHGANCGGGGFSDDTAPQAGDAGMVIIRYRP